MKFVIMFGAIIIAVLFSIIPDIRTKKPFWWKLTATILVVLSLILTLLPPISGSIKDTINLKNGFNKILNIHISNKPELVNEDKINNLWQIDILKTENITNIQNKNLITKVIILGQNLPEEFKKNNNIIIKTKYNKEYDALEYIETVSVNPFLEYPFVNDLVERIKILNLHVPLAWIAVIAFLMSMIYAIRYLISKDLKWDNYTVATAELGTLFSILATVTGMLWAKFNWGAYWNWDPRQTSIFILILIYAAYFALRSSIDNEERRAKLSSVYSILSFITVPFLIFILPRMSSGLHPGSASDNNSGPIVSQQGSSLDTTLVYGFGLALLSFSILYFWLLNLSVRYKNLSNKIN